MPIYEYRCCQCETRFERLLPMSRADDPDRCPECGSEEIGRCLSRFSAFSRSDGQSRSVGATSNCASCAATSCASCKG